MSLLKGVGAGLRAPHIESILAGPNRCDFFELLVDNYRQITPIQRGALENIASTHPVTLHSVGMNLGGTDPLNRNYLRWLRAMIDDFRPGLVSDHVAWTGCEGREHHDLLPLPYNDEALVNLIERIGIVQNELGHAIAVENPSAYVAVQLGGAQLSEWDFLREVVKGADCKLLIDINNVYVNAHNFGFNPKHYIDALDEMRVAQYHLAGYEDRGDYLFDNHASAVKPDVWELFEYAIERIGPRPTLIEWDHDVPAFAALEDEVVRAKEVIRCCVNGSAS